MSTLEQNAQSIAFAAQPLQGAPAPLLIALDGRCAAGKTTLANRLAEQYGWGVIHLDDFFLQPAQRTPQRLAEPGGNLDRDRLISEVLLPLTRHRPGVYRVFDCRTMGFAAVPRPLPAAPVVLLEGSYACHPDLRPLCGLHVFLTVDPGEQLRRLTARNPARLQDFRTRWIPMEEQYFRYFHIPETCDLTLVSD
ncbi:uridine kinase family protein [Gemmiger sp.]|uniref:uridine kinase family protein n=1 Tax=Gemmiger sp. TaxID=2049027 RepID=UPI003F0665EB